MDQVNAVEDTWLARGKVTRGKKGIPTLDISALRLGQEDALLIDAQTVRVLTRPLMSDEISQRHRAVTLTLGVPEAFDGCTELYCWAESEESAKNRIWIRLRSQ